MLIYKGLSDRLLVLAASDAGVYEALLDTRGRDRLHDPRRGRHYTLPPLISPLGTAVLRRVPDQQLVCDESVDESCW